VARAAGAEVSAGRDFMEISFPAPAGAAPATVARATAAPSAAPLAAAPPGAGPRALGGGAVLARATSSGSGESSSTDTVTDAIMRALREENEHLGILDGIDPLL
jgi:hypothetical protein